LPESAALPLPPRSLDQRTRYSRRLSLAWPDSVICAVPPTSPLCSSMDTLGADLSIERQRRRSACAISLSSSNTSVLDASLPPQPAMPRTVSACATTKAVLFSVSFIPNDSSGFGSSCARPRRATHSSGLLSAPYRWPATPQ